MLFEIYGAVVATFAILTAMYVHAYRSRTALALTPAELLDARVQTYRNVGFVAIGLVSIIVAAIAARLAPNQAGAAGLVYFAIELVEWGLGEYHGRMRKRLVT